MKGKRGGLMVDAILGVSAACLLALYVVDRPSPNRSATAPELQFMNEWQDVAAAGMATGQPEAPLAILELMDFQCVFCRQWAVRVDSLVQEYPNAVRVSFHHFPLPSHAHSLRAAVAAECAEQQGSFQEFKRTLFERQDEIGSTPWTDFAAAAGVSDLRRFQDCQALPADSFPRIAYGRELAAKYGARGTPTVWINGRPGRMSLDEMRASVAQHQR